MTEQSLLMQVRHLVMNTTKGSLGIMNSKLDETIIADEGDESKIRERALSRCDNSRTAWSTVYVRHDCLWGSQLTNSRSVDTMNAGPGLRTLEV